MQSVEQAVLIVVAVVTVGAIALALWTRWSERSTGSTWDKVIASESMKIPFAHTLTEYCRTIHSRKDKGAGKERGLKKKIKIERVTDFWELAGLLFDRKTRDKIYCNYINEIREDFIIVQRACRSKASFRWVKLCFGIRGSINFFQCLGIMLWAPVSKLIPEKIRQFWNLFS